MKPQAVFFDLDSTLVTLEGLDWIAEQKGIGERMKEITRKAMNGEMSMDEALKEKMKSIRPSRQDIMALGGKYCETLVDGVPEVIQTLQKNQIVVGIISGTFNPAAHIVAERLNIPFSVVFANEGYFFDDGTYKSYNTNYPLARNEGKAEIIQQIKDQYETVTFIGDGVTDLETIEYVDTFIGFGGVVRRPVVQQKAKYYVESSNLMDILPIILNNK